MEPPQTLIDKLEHYRPGEDVAALLGSVPILFIVGISGAGKDTLRRELLKLGHYHNIVTHTTRQPRRNQGVLEQDGVEYHFIDFATSEHMLDNQGYIEAKRYGNNIYGTSVAEFQLAHDEQKIALADIDVQGVAEFMAIASENVRPVFLLPPSYDEWQRRFLQRYGDDHADHSDDIKLRMQTAEKELSHVLESDYFFLVVNQELDKTIETVDRIARTAQQAAEDKNAATKVAKAILEELRRQLAVT